MHNSVKSVRAYHIYGKRQPQPFFKKAFANKTLNIKWHSMSLDNFNYKQNSNESMSYRSLHPEN